MRYDIRNKETGEISECSMPFTELDNFLLEHPDLEVVILSARIGDPVILGVQRPPSDFINHIIAPIEKHYFGKRRESKFSEKAHQV